MQCTVLCFHLLFNSVDVCLYKYSFWNICNLAISHISSLIDGNVLFCFLNFLSLLNLASTFDSELQLREGIYLPTQLNMAHFTTYYNLSSKSIFIYLFQFFTMLFLFVSWFSPCFSALVQTRCQTFSKFQLSIQNKKLTRGWDTGYLNINCWKMDKNSSDWLMGNVLTEASQLFTLGFLWFTEHMFDILLNCFHLNTPRSH